MKLIPLTRGFVAQVDDDDFERLMEWKWYAQIGHNKRHYANHKPRGGPALVMHRLVIGAKSGEFVDHIDGDGLNNQRNNLRLCTNRQNQRNALHDGVCLEKSRRQWVTHIRIDAGRIKLGRFENRDDAVATYRAASLRHHGEFSPYWKRMGG
jgi:hypothetical protein